MSYRETAEMIYDLCKNADREPAIKAIRTAMAYHVAIENKTTLKKSLYSRKALEDALQIPKEETLSKPMTLSKLVTLLRAKLKRNPTYGDFMCGRCKEDIVEGSDTCPFCGGSFQEGL